VFAALDRLGVDPSQRQHTGRGRRHAVLQQLGIVDDLRVRRREGFHDRQRPAGGAARRIQRELRRVPQPLDAFAVLAPVSEARRPSRRFRGRKGFRGLPGSPRLVGVYPRQKICRVQFRKSQQQISEIALRVNGNHRDAIDRAFFDQVNAEAGFAAAGHADDHAMRDEIGGVVKKRGRRIELSAQVKQAELLEVGH
jgi:hypothetical protein